MIEEAAAVAGLSPKQASAAARDPELDLRLDATSRGLRARGVVSPPAINMGRNWFDGQDALIAAISLSAARSGLDTPGLPAS